MPNIDIACLDCSKPGKSNQKGVFCDSCRRWVHAKCAKLSENDFHALGISNDSWFCALCLQTIFPFNRIVDDKEFIVGVTSSDQSVFNSQPHLCYDKLPVFNSFQFNETRYLLNNENFDPDVNYFNDLKLSDSVYCVASDISSISVNMSENVSKYNFSVLNANCRDISRCFNDVTNMVADLDFNLTALALSETWTTLDTEELYHIDGYTSVFKSRDSDKSGGGVGLYINDSVLHTVRSDLCPQDNCAETLFVELPHDNVIIGCVYRPPGNDVNLFTAYLDLLLTKINHKHKTAFITKR